ncbi:TonB-dependent receptor [Pedobacter cryophilus]|uniref:TonB-dependent receptor n=1 Tax=Pedobacter cryophilus TaxID=2571271 RepID=A0A4U1CAI5_9SPHI|nr:TonB-dependent receptor [Pedobacter cryophilus]TKC00708.1 TonB-dependent receptor [Pedobacter cryophilus]
MKKSVQKLNYLSVLLLKKWLLMLLLILGASQIFAQNTPRTAGGTTPPPIPVRQVSGIVKDSTDQTLIGATITLTSVADTLRTSTNEDGVFIFKGVKAWVFSLKVSSIGYTTKVIAGKYNDATARLTLDPITLKADNNILNEVIVNGTPSIVYKTDTVEFRASDYVVRQGATVDELLQKMEGFEVGNDGSVSVNGTAIAKARLNGKDIYGGDVAAAIQNLPAEIVEKIQVVDDYGNTAARTGVKEGDPTKVLNITTRADKSVGMMARLNAGAGTMDQLEGSANLTRINKNQTITVNTTLQQTPNGIAGGNASVGRLGGAANRGGRSGEGFGGGGGGNATGGTNTRTAPAFTYRDKFGTKVDFLANYSYRYTNNNTQTISNSLNISDRGETFSNRDALNASLNKAHTISFELEYAIDSANYLQFTPNLSFTNSSGNSSSSNFQTGLINQDQLNINNNSNTRPNIGGTIAYQHIFKKPSRSFSLEATVGQQQNDSGAEQDNNIIYRDGQQNIVRDSVVHRFIGTNNLQNNYRGSLTYSEPLGKLSRLEFNSNIEYRAYDNSRLTSNIDNIGNQIQIDSLSNIFEYAFTQYRNSFNYRYGNNNSLFSYSLGLTAVSTSLVGTKASLGTSTDQQYFKLIPIARLQVKLSSTHRISLNYNGRANEPEFNQIQPVRDVSNPQNAIVGNPNLKVAFTHSINGQYSNYIANLKLNYDLRLSTSFTENQVTSNILQVNDAYGSLKNETQYVNLNGNKSHNADYSISKQLNDRKYSLSFSGNMVNSNRVSMSNGIINTSTTWGFKENFGPRMTPKPWLEINPYVSFDINKTNYSLARNQDVTQKIWAISLDGNIYFAKKYQFGYALSKNYVSGIGNNVTNNPFIINTMLQVRVFKNKGTLQLRAYDLLKQNNFINRTQNGLGFTETLTNPNSRYVMLNLSMNLQKWTGAVGGNNRNIIRRGDGSFMN